MCRVADQLSLPTRRELLQYYGGTAHMPPQPCADYWRANMVTTAGHSRQHSDFLFPECSFRSELPAEEQWIESQQVRCLACVVYQAIRTTLSVNLSSNPPKQPLQWVNSSECVNCALAQRALYSCNPPLRRICGRLAVK